VNITLHVSEGLSVHHQEFKAVHTASGICHTGSGSISCSLAKQSTKLYDIYLMLYVQPWTPDDGQKDCPKHVVWYLINPKIVLLVGFTIEIPSQISPFFNVAFVLFATDFEWPPAYAVYTEYYCVHQHNSYWVSFIVLESVLPLKYSLHVCI